MYSTDSNSVRTVVINRWLCAIVLLKNVWSMKNISAIFLYKVNCALYSNTVIDQCIRCKILIDY